MASFIPPSDAECALNDEWGSDAGLMLEAVAEDVRGPMVDEMIWFGAVDVSSAEAEAKTWNKQKFYVNKESRRISCIYANLRALSHSARADEYNSDKY
jgi:hypothetical protein